MFRNIKIIDKNSPIYPLKIAVFFRFLLGALSIFLGFAYNTWLMKIFGFACALDFFNNAFIYIGANQATRISDINFNYGYGKYQSFAYLIASMGLLHLLLTLIYKFISSFGGAVYAFNNWFYLFSAIVIVYSLYFTRYSADALRKTANENRINIDLGCFIFKKNGLIEIIALLTLIAFAILPRELDFYADYIGSCALIIFPAIPSIKKMPSSIRQLLDSPLDEQSQFEILAAIVENIDKFCQYKSFHSRQSGDEVFIEIDAVMPDDANLTALKTVESRIAKSLKSNFPKAIVRLYASPCENDCDYKDKSNCPIRKTLRNLI